ncbi:MAG: metallophosphoesterase family protein [Candidatus Eremiobacteraeota bacterium]|nr:metallophosphoesterase family protein [Candidatus Eremiobacteraeota bacterium]
MRFTFISDIHSNVESLEAVFARIPASDTVLCLGDVVGYGPNPNECLALLRARVHASVLGNHDVAAVDGYGIEYFNPAARAAIEWTRTVIDPGHVAWLDGLSYELRLDDFLMVHGAPVEYFTYILDKGAAARAFAATDAPLVFVGHTHVADYYALARDGSIAHAHRQHGGVLALEPGMRYIVNAGSVGQPRDLNPEASFATFDSDARSVTWQRVAYPLARTQEKIEAARLPEVLARRLASGR